MLLLAAAALQQGSADSAADTIVVTGSREPVTIEDAAVSATVFDAAQLE